MLLSFAEKSDSVVLLFSLLGGLNSPTFGLSAERASRLRPKSSIHKCRLIFLVIIQAFSMGKIYFGESDTY